jgi:CheY-like chemotaxis protein
MQVLIIDDDDDIRTTLGLVLELRGHEPAVASHGKDALGMLAAGLRPSVILLDLMMPVMNGWDFLATIAKDKDLAQIPVVVLTGYSNMVANKTPPGAVALLNKPVDVSRLHAILGRYA